MGFRSIGIGHFVSFWLSMHYTDTLMLLHYTVYVISIIYVMYTVSGKKRPEYFSHNFDKFRRSFVIFGTNHPDTSV